MSEEVEIDVEVVTHTNYSICVENLNNELVWIPRSQISDYSGDEERPDSIFIPQWLAEKEELV